MLIRISKSAKLAFLSILDRYNEFAGPMSADRFALLVDEKLEMLAKYPYVGHPEPLLIHKRRKYKAKSINKHYDIIYYVTKTTIWVVDFWDRQCDPLRLANRIRG